jgi:esterase/lipase superfamily enzyme
MEVLDYTLTREDKDYDVSVYGNAGRVAIAFPEGDSTCTSWENGGMVGALSQLIDAGELQLVCVDSADDESWYFREGDPAYRYENLSAFYDFVEEDLLDFVAKHTSSKQKPILIGAGMGAVNAAVEAFHHPELFGGLLAMSGAYDARYYLGGDLDDDWKSVSPVDIAAELDPKSKAGKALSAMPTAFVCGQSEYEHGIETQRALDTLFAQKGIESTFEYWGYDVTPDWGWWQEEAGQLLPCILEENGLVARKLVAKEAAAKAEADRAAQVRAEAENALAEAKKNLAAAKEHQKRSEERLDAEYSVVSERKEVEKKLAAEASLAWQERDKAAAALGEAVQKGNIAQAAADKAASDRAAAEWIAGEARAAVESAKASRSDAEKRLARAEAALKDALAADKRAAEGLAKTEEEIQAELG